MDNYKDSCSICFEPDDSDIDCPGWGHKQYKEAVKKNKDKTPVEEIQIATCGAYVNPKTGKIVKAKALNNPVTLGME